MASANRDADQYPEPDKVDLNRSNPRSHIAFSAGIGACAGAALARAELQEGISRIVNRLRDLRFAPVPPPVLEDCLPPLPADPRGVPG